MVNPKILMAHVLTLFTLIVQAQSLSDNNILCYIGADNAPHKVNKVITQDKPYELVCKFEDGTTAIPKFFQFSCDEGASSLTVQITITDGEHTQVITKEIQIREDEYLYEVPVLAAVMYDLMQTGRAHVKSISFKNNMNLPVHLSEVNFSNATANYEIKLNQVFTVDLRNQIQKRYYFNAPTFQSISINMYQPNGEFNQKITKDVVKGDNFLHFEKLDVKEGKYVIVITENDPKKAPSNRITVMN